ncbi:MAG: transposase [Ruminococcaceae bacterium]|nr:transposase [Oscillospiraceae bacterium]
MNMGMKMLEEKRTGQNRNNFVLDVTVVPGNVHDGVSFDELYDKVTERFPEIEVVTVDAGYKTPWICKKIFDDGRIPSMPYKRPQTKEGFFKNFNSTDRKPCLA